MPRMDGTGPIAQGITAKAAGRCYSRGRNADRNDRPGRGLGICRYEAKGSRELLIARHAMLKQRLAALESKLQQL